MRRKSATVYWPGVERRQKLNLIPEGGIRPPRPPQSVGLEASKMVDLYLISNTNQPFWKPSGRHIGGVWGADAPPGIKLSCVLSQPRASTGDLNLQRSQPRWESALSCSFRRMEVSSSPSRRGVIPVAPCLLHPHALCSKCCHLGRPPGLPR